jgi:hypothetical protein
MDAIRIANPDDPSQFVLVEPMSAPPGDLVNQIAKDWSDDRALLTAAVGLACHGGGDIRQTIDLAKQLCRTVYEARIAAAASVEAAARKFLAERAARAESVDAAAT